MATTCFGMIEAKFDPKETMIKPWPPELLTNFSKSGGRGLTASLTLSGPTITFPVDNQRKKDLQSIYNITVTNLRTWRPYQLPLYGLPWLHAILVPSAAMSNVNNDGGSGDEDGFKRERRAKKN